MRPTAIAALLLLVAARASAQAPIVTPSGDPSIDPDTIYRLAVDPKAHPQERIALLLDDGIVVENADGTGTATYRQITQVLTREAVATVAEHTFGFDADRQVLRVNWAKVVRPDGTVVSDKPLQEQTSDVPAQLSNPVYQSLKQVRVSLGGVEPGTIVDLSWTTETKKPVMDKDFFSSWSITTGSTVRRSRFVLDVPEGYAVRIQEKNVARPAKATTARGRKTMEWTAADLDWMEPESFIDARASTVFQSLEAAGPTTWEEIGAWYASLARPRYVLTDEVRQAARATVGSASTDREKLQALHRWIAQDIRYISISLGQGGYQPRFPADVLKSLSGDCKDKATLFVMVARELGFTAYPVLLNLGGTEPDELPHVGAFNHAIAAVRLDGGWTFVDLTADLVPFGHLPVPYQGKFGLLVFDDGKVERVTFPKPSPNENEIGNHLSGEITPDGAFKGALEASVTGNSEYGLRALMARDLGDRERSQLALQMAGLAGRGGHAQLVRAFNGRDLSAPAILRVEIESPRQLQRSGDGWIYTLPLANYANPALVARLEEELPRRRQPISVDQVVSPLTIVSDLTLTLPEGWTAALPQDVTVDGVWGTYRARYRQEGRKLTVSREMVGKGGSQPKEALHDLIDWIKALSQDDVSVLTLKPAD